MAKYRLDAPARVNQETPGEIGRQLICYLCPGIAEKKLNNVKMILVQIIF